MSGVGGLSGVCYTAEECAAMPGGRAAGECASGFGVCCLCECRSNNSRIANGQSIITSVEIGCDSRSSENCTHFSSSAFTGNDDGGDVCAATVCRCSDDVCQLRLDFLSFVLPGKYVLIA